MGKKIKNGWVELPIENILAPNGKGIILGQGWSPQCEQQPSQSENNWGVLKTTAIQSGYFLEEENKLLPLHLEPRTQHEVKKGDLLITCAGPRNRCGVACLVRKTRKKLMISGKMYRFRINEKKAIPEYVELFLLSQETWKEIDKMKTGGSDSGLNLTHARFKKLIVPIPPLREQHRMVTKIEELFSELDKGVEALKTAQQQLKVYRQAVLKWAFEGKLTNRNIVEGESPKGWKKVKLGEVVKTIDGDRGPNYPKKNEFLQKGYCLFLSTKNVREDSFVFKDNIFISKEKDEKLRGGKLQLSDVVITTRGTLGNVALYDEKIPYKHIRINSGMLILRITNESLNNYYLMKFITSPIFISQLKEKQSGTAQPQIPANVLREIEIPLSPIPEQHAIVAEIESRLSVCDKIEESIEQNLKHSEVLRQSILKKAFAGKLVPQDPSDEPASKLLERIKAEKAAQPPVKKKIDQTKKDRLRAE